MLVITSLEQIIPEHPLVNNLHQIPRIVAQQVFMEQPSLTEQYNNNRIHVFV